MSLNLEFCFNVPCSVIYEALVNKTRIQQYTRAIAEVEEKEGGNFSMLDGKIQGRFLALRQNQYIKMEWKFNNWNSFSIVEIIFREEQQDQCEITISQSNIPEEKDKQKLQIGWKHQIIQPMSQILGYPLKN